MNKTMGVITVVAVALSFGVPALAEDQWKEVASLSSPLMEEEVGTQSVAQWIDEKVAAYTFIGREELIKNLSASAANNAETTFKSYIADPVPQEIKILDGNSTHWQGFSAYLIFKTNQEALQDITKGYTNIPFEQVKAQAKGWFSEDITKNPNILCYYKRDDFNNSYYLFWDREAQRAFFKGLENT